jgi:hypothetical protein
MKNLIIIFGIVLLAILASFRFHNSAQTSIVGKVNPIDGATSVQAISGKDSANANIVSGSFGLSVKPGIYHVVVVAVAPYKDAVLDNISVKEDQTIDLGEIVLQK